ncbi:nuclear transport factor 2 family protein [Nocardioides sp. LS1]|uniref:nuclear transport factor 2 family protein n=1 Tax=Nocardioides sp. LS1 TaxID=1027620 RepID=UPI0021AB2EED|nr:nuclear transport factor 2 family protein [Nocardioides sp. LS1]
MRADEGEMAGSDEAEIEDVVRAFFGAFTSGPDTAARLETLRDLFLPGAVIVSTGGRGPALMDVDAFIAPRAALLSGGTLVGFREWAEEGRTDVFGDVAHWFGSYAKEWEQDGQSFGGRGMKSLQLVRTPQGWRISAAAWDDER